MPDSWLSAVSPSVLSPVKRAALLLLLAALLLPPAAALGQATPTPPRSFVWDQIDVTVELREDGALHVTERDRVAFTGGPFQVGYRDIPLARIERIDQVRVGEMDGEFIRPYRLVAPEQFSRDVPNTFSWQEIGGNLRIDWSIEPATSESRTFQIEYDAYGALGVHADADPPYQEISWIGVDTVLTEFAPVNEASLTVILPRAIELSEAAVQGPGGDHPADHTADGQTWVWRASGLGPGESLEAGLRFPPLADAEAPAWQEASDRAGNATPIAQATPVAAPPDLPLCRQVIESDFPGQRRELLADCVTERPIFVPENWVFDGGGHVIHARDPAGGVLTGGVIEVTAAGSVVQDVIVDGSLLAAPCQNDDGATFVAGMVFRSAPGAVTGVTVRAMRRELAPGVDAGSASIRLRKSCGIGVVVMGGSGPVSINEAVIADVAYAGVVVDSAQASISQTVIDRAETFGIQVHNGQVRITPGNRIRDGLIGIQIEGGGGGRVAGATIEGMAKSGIEVIGARVTVADSRIADVGETGILMHDASGAIQANSIDDAAYGIAASGGGEIEVTGNTVRRPADSGIFATDTGTEVTIADNAIETSALDGVWVQQGARAAMRDNRVIGSARYGIAAIGVGTSADLVQNRIAGAQSGGILVKDGARASVADNTLLQPGTNGIEIDAAVNVLVAGNVIADARSNGIRLHRPLSGAVAGSTEPDILRDNEIRGGGSGIAVTGSGANVSVAANRVEGVSGAGLAVSAGAAAVIEGNTVAAAGTGIDVAEVGTAASLMGNRITDAAERGILIQEGAEATLEQNTVLRAGTSGIGIDGEGTTASLTGNIVTDAAESGIMVERGAAATIADGNVVSGGAWGISILSEGTVAQVRGNQIGGASNQGIAVVYGAHADVSDNAIEGDSGIYVRFPGSSAVITGNTITAARQGILVWEEATVERIADNDISGAVAGIAIEGTGGRAVIEGNRIAEFGREGIAVRDGASAEVSDNRVRRNQPGSDAWGIIVAGRDATATITDNDVSEIDGIGIEFSQGAGGEARDNTIVDISRTGIRVAYGGRGVTVRGNTVRDPGRIGIEVRVSDAVIRDNTVQGATLTAIQLGPGGAVEASGNTIVGPAASDADAPGPYGIDIQRGASGPVTDNRISGMSTAAACAIRIDAGAADISLADNVVPAPGSDPDFCDERRVERGTPEPIGAPTAGGCRVPEEFGPNVAVVATRTTLLQRSPTDAWPPRPIIARGTRLLIAPSVTGLGGDAVVEACQWLPVVVVETGQPGFVPARHLALADPAS